MSTPLSKRPYDIVIFGATGYTGFLTAKYLSQCNERKKLSWALAGRSPSKLEEAKRKLTEANPGVGTNNIGIINADINDAKSLRSMAEQCHVIITTVGPYLHYGETLVKACIEAETHYVDLTGEPEFVDAIAHYYDEVAEKKRIKIVNSCGFDSIPHDLGALFTVNAINQLIGKDHAEKESISIEGFVRAGGTFSGGTWHSAITQFSRIRSFYEKKKHWDQAKKRSQSTPQRRVGTTPMRIQYKKEFGRWACPLPTIDPQVVRRSARARSNYGPNFKYGHFALVKELPTVLAGLAGISSLVALSQVSLTRNLLLKIKAPGDGPTDAEREKGWFSVKMLGKARDLMVWTEISGGDPGYGETAKMLAESALCLAFDQELSPKTYGVITPAVAMGEPLIGRLENAGIKFQITS
ncbi:saccharopine dehydrogenase [Gammaproteobacteria bacterium 45_16_T64]|nr:saccharopine dehydrogenase [Gammaproteobacteria bacterium 45_16_T64]